jgi:hypothetical protein
VLVALGLLGFALALPAADVGTVVFDAHTLLYSSLAIICGYEAALFGLFAKSVAIAEGLLPADRRLEQFARRVTLERTLLAGGAAIVVGGTVLTWVFVDWAVSGFGALDYADTMRWVIPAATATALGFTTILAGFFATAIGLGRHGRA